jgi:glutamine cyclotransferase
MIGHVGKRWVLWTAAGAGALAIGSLIVFLAAPSDLLAQSCSEPATLRFEIADRIPRSEIDFTQGLEFHDGQLYESTGRIGGSTRLNTISLKGEVKRLTDRGTSVFGEGLTILNNEIYQLTWQEHQVFVYDLDGKQKRTMRNPHEGWGLTNDSTNLIFSDGGPSFYYADPKTFAIRKSVKLRSNRPGEITGLNELELVNGHLFGNIFLTWTIVRLDPASGCVDGVADLHGLWNVMQPDERAQIESDGNNVLNGIAYDSKAGLFYVTGKRWKTIYTGHFVTASK